MIEVSDEGRFHLWIISILFGFILGLIQIFGIYKFYKIKDLLIVIKRYPSIVLIESIATILYLIIAFPGIGYNVLRPPKFDIISVHKLFKILGNIIYPFTGHFIVIAELSRLWLIFFDLNYLKAIKNESWKSKINEKQYDFNNNFYLKNRNKYGNKQWIISRSFIFYIIISIISCLLFISLFDNKNIGESGPQIVHFIDGLLYGISIISIIFLYIKLPKNLNEQFLFNFEFKTTTFLFGFGLIIYLFDQIISFFDKTISSTITVFIAAPSICIVSLISTLYIPQKIINLANWDKILIHQNDQNDQNFGEINLTSIQQISSQTQTRTQTTTSNIDDNDDNLSNKQKLTNLLENQYKIELFIQHLNEEFSLEIMLSFIEFLQFRQYLAIISIKYKYINQEMIYYINEYKLPQTQIIPKSTIVYNENLNDSICRNEQELIKFFKEIAYQLYKKYIIANAELQINISHELNKKFWKQMNNKMVWLNTKFDNDGLLTLIHLFDDAIDEMFYLQMQSFVRFNMK